MKVLCEKSGFGWDDVNEIVTVDDQTWEDLLSMPVGIFLLICHLP